MERQLTLLESHEAAEREWRLDDATKDLGRRGVAAARAAAREALQHARRQPRVTPDRRHDAA
jgi:hypothetical protein